MQSVCLKASMVPEWLSLVRAGSIGSSVVETALRFKPATISLMDLSENNLVEVVRNLRSYEGIELPDEFATLPIGFAVFGV